MTTITAAELAHANIQRKRQGKRPLTRDQAQVAVATTSAIDVDTLLVGYLLYETLSPHSHSVTPEPSTFDGGGGDFGGGGASSSWSDSSPSSDSSSF